MVMWTCIIALYFATACHAVSEYIILATDEAKGLIYHAYVDTTEQDNIELTPLPMTIGGRLQGVEYDPVEKRVYWTEFSPNKIKRVSMDGSNMEVLRSGIKTPSLAIDVHNRKIYNGGANDKIIRVRNMDFEGDNVLSSSPALEEPADIAIDQTNGYIYISDVGRNVIERMRTDTGEDREVVVSDENVNGIDLDLTDGQLYWTNHDGNEIRVSNLSGSGKRTIANSKSLPQLTDPIDVASLGGYLYILSGSSDRLIRISKDGTNLEFIGNNLFSAPKNIIVRKIIPDATWTTTPAPETTPEFSSPEVILDAAWTTTPAPETALEFSSSEVIPDATRTTTPAPETTPEFSSPEGIPDPIWTTTPAPETTLQSSTTADRLLK